MLLFHICVWKVSLLHQEDEPIDKHTHVRFLFTDGTELHYKDVRKFGTMHLFKKVRK